MESGVISQICILGVSQHCQCGQPGGGDQHGEEAPEGHPGHLGGGEARKESLKNNNYEDKRRSGRISEKETKGGDAGVSIL